MGAGLDNVLGRRPVRDDVVTRHRTIENGQEFTRFPLAGCVPAATRACMYARTLRIVH